MIARRGRRALWVSGAVAIVLGGCNAIFGITGGELTSTTSSTLATSSGSSSGTGGVGGSTTMTTSSSSSSSSSSSGSSDAGATCQGKAGPTMVVVGSYCIDSTEVTVKDYIKFLTAVQPTADAGLGDAGAGSVPASCATNPTFWQPSCQSLAACCGTQMPAPATGCCPYPSIDGPHPTSAMDPYPIGCVNWCDAYAYCTWAGKRLCGQIGGGSLTFGPLLSNAKYDEWYQACSMNGAKVYPYGDKFKPQTCAGVEYVTAMGLPADPQPVASLAGCVGGYPGIYDMSGNASEWENACAGNGPTDQCADRGGSTNNNDISDTGGAAGPGLSCGASAPDAGPIKYTVGGIGRLFAGYVDVGFRCCADLQ